MKVLLACAMLILFLVPTVGWSQATNDSPAPSGSESLGSQLLDDLAPSVLPKSAVPMREPATEQQSSDNPLAVAPRFDDLGEDIGQANGPLSLVRVRQGMQRAEALLDKSKSTADGRTLQQTGNIQKQVVAQLDQLIAELSKQCQGGQCQPSDQPPKPSQRSQAKPGKSGSKPGGGKTAARDSSDPLNRTNAKPVEKGDMDAVVKALWGHLPERSREQMLQSFSDEFLPKYELEIEQYYRRLSEEEKNSEFE